jgi:hypothetical protein
MARSHFVVPSKVLSALVFLANGTCVLTLFLLLEEVRVRVLRSCFDYYQTKVRDPSIRIDRKALGPTGVT